MKSSYRLEASFQAELSRNLIREESRVERIWIRGLLSEVNKQRKKAFSEKASVHVRVRWRCSHFDFYRDWVGIKYTHDLSFFFFGMPLRQQGVPRTSGAKTKQGELFVGINPLIAY